MVQDKSKEMAYFRYGVINPLLSKDSIKSLKDRMKEQADKIWTLPDGRQKTYSWMTVEDWYYTYTTKGFDGLVNPPRKDKGKYRGISEALYERVDKLLSDYPSLKSSNIITMIDDEGLRPDKIPSDSTIFRYIRSIRPAKQTLHQERRCFEAPYAGNLWQTDIMYGPYVNVKQANGKFRKQQTYLIAIIDDHSRLLCHGQFYLKQDIMAYIDTLKKAIEKRGIPERVYCDNGQVFLSPQIKRIGAQIGFQISHTAVRDAAAKGKIERVFKSLQDSLLNKIMATNPPKSIDELNSVFWKWMEEYNNKPHSSIDCTPIQRWLISSDKVRLFSWEKYSEDVFLIEATRRVKKDGTFSLNKQRYETSWTLSGKSVQIRYDPLHMPWVYVYDGHNFFGKAYPLDKSVNFNLPRIKRKLDHEK